MSTLKCLHAHGFYIQPGGVWHGAMPPHIGDDTTHSGDKGTFEELLTNLTHIQTTQLWPELDPGTQNTQH